MLAGFLASFSSKESKESTPQLFSVDIRYITSVYTRWADSSVTFPHPVKIFLTQASSRPIVGTLLAPIGYFLPVRPLLASAQQKQVRSSSRHKPKAVGFSITPHRTCCSGRGSRGLKLKVKPSAALFSQTRRPSLTISDHQPEDWFLAKLFFHPKRSVMSWHFPGMTYRR